MIVLLMKVEVQSDEPLETEASICVGGVAERGLPLGKRFSRKSGSRSKSRQDSREPVPAPFFIKNVCQQALQSDRSKDMLTRLQPAAHPSPSKAEAPSTRRPAPWQRSRRSGSQLAFESSTCCSQRCLEVQCQRAAAVETSRQLQQQLAQLEHQLSTRIQENALLTARIRKLERDRDLSHPGFKEIRNSNLHKLKKQIVESRNAEAVVSIEGLEQQLRQQQADNLLLRDHLRKTEQRLVEVEAAAQADAAVRQDHLQLLAAQMQAQLAQREEALRKLKIEVAVLRMRDERRQANQQDELRADLAYWKQKHEKAVQQLRAVSRELTGLQRSRTNALPAWSSSSSRSASLSLSP